MNTVRTMLVMSAVLAAFAGAARAQMQLPSVIGDNMVLQRGTDAPVWGWDGPGTEVTVTFRGHDVQATAGEDGKWMARVPTGDAGGPFELAVKGTDQTTLKNVMVGEVWIAGGQSNMWWYVSNCTDAQQVIAASDDPGIRFYDANTGPREAGWPADTPQRTIDTNWQVAGPQTVGSWAGVAYFFAQDLRKELGVPVGIVHVAVPGSQIEPFLSSDFFKTNFPNATDEQAGRFFNGMILPVAPFAAKGFIWWQGESNAGRSLQYQILFPSLIEEWRHLWGMNEAPFLFVELANFWDVQRRSVEDDQWPALRDAQRAALQLDNTYMACVIDILPADDARNIHPPHKQLAGHRLFLAAMANAYGKADLEWSGPTFRSVSFEDGAATVIFDHAEGLTAKGGGSLKGFAVCGEDRRWQWADGNIRGSTVVLTSKDVPHPVAVRYDWANNPIGNLYNAAGLPAAPFRSDHYLLCMGGKM